ncbi:unnamed protein product, partial [marine sediment metagenome]
DNTPTARFATWTSMFEGATAKESLLLGSAGNSILDVSTTYYFSVAQSSNYQAVENDTRQICPTAGKIKNLYVELSIDPGAAPDALRFTLRKNGVSQLLTVTIVADDTTGNDTVNEVTVAAGDILTMMVEPVSTPTGMPYFHWGMTFVADTDGESIILGGDEDDLNTGATEYNHLCGFGSNWTANEADRYQLGQLCTLKKLYVLLSAAPGDGKSYTFTLRKPGNGQADGNLTV